jgi:ubiquinone/menaquinone biosynthesis C-methylase UbiE
MNYFKEDNLSAFDAKSEAQRIAFAPVTFQACRILRDSGILELVQKSRAKGMTLDDVVAKVSLPRYGVKVLMESGLGIGLFCLSGGDASSPESEGAVPRVSSSANLTGDEGVAATTRFTLTKLGYFMLHDEMTRVNMDVVHDICYRGLHDLDKSIEQGKPVGLKTLGDWNTFYEGLSSLPPHARKSWLAFDHYYSDAAFPAALPLVFADKPKRLLDVGGNTGKWAVQCAKFNPNVHITIADLDQQLVLAHQTIKQQGLEDRVSFHATDLLDESNPLPTGYDAIWMSQFLDCFSEAEIVSILKRAAAALAPGGTLYILELFWDRQPNATAAFCLQQTSLYFTCIANGNSQMYHSSDLLRCIAASGLKMIEDRDQVGLYHTLLKCRKV